MGQTDGWTLDHYVDSDAYNMSSVNNSFNLHKMLQ